MKKVNLMHMANELLSVPVAAGTIALAGSAIGIICSRLKQALTSDKLPLMGILGAFVFAAQMVNFQLPLMPGTSGHMVGAVLLAIILGPAMASIVMTSIIIVQCLFFQDGGLLALGCNIINMGIAPTYIGYYLYKAINRLGAKSWRVYAATMASCIVAIEAGAVLVAVQATLSAVLIVPLKTFLTTMLSVHLLVGLVEGTITCAVLGYLQQVRPDIVSQALPGTIRASKKAVLATLVIVTIITGTILSLFASQNPDGLEWSYLERPDNPGFAPIVKNESTAIESADNLQSKYAPMPDYTTRHDEASVSSSAWTSFAAVTGSAATMGVIYLFAFIMKRRHLAVSVGH